MTQGSFFLKNPFFCFRPARTGGSPISGPGGRCVGCCFIQSGDDPSFAYWFWDFKGMFSEYWSASLCLPPTTCPVSEPRDC